MKKLVISLENRSINHSIDYLHNIKPKEAHERRLVCILYIRAPLYVRENLKNVNLKKGNRDPEKSN